jgi:hypothetical protein
MTESVLPDGPADLQMEVFGEGEAGALVPTGVGDLALLLNGWMESHSPEGGRGAHLAIRQARRADAVPLVVHVSQVPALVAALTEVSLRLTQLWERDGREYWAGHPPPGGTGPQDPGPHAVEIRPAVESESGSDESRRARRRAKVEVLERVHGRAPEVLAAFLEAEDDDEAARSLAPLVEVSEELAADLVRHLQFRELTRAARRSHAES